jgi:hypothetical protein
MAAILAGRFWHSRDRLHAGLSAVAEKVCRKKSTLTPVFQVGKVLREGKRVLRDPLKTGVRVDFPAGGRFRWWLFRSADLLWPGFSSQPPFDHETEAIGGVDALVLKVPVFACMRSRRRSPEAAAAKSRL